MTYATFRTPISFKTCLLLLLLAAACSTRPGDRIRVVAATANIASVVEAVGGSRVRVTTVAPAGLCPGHFDIRPSDVSAAEQADLLVNQGWEEWFPRLEAGLRESAVVRYTARTQGNWMLPVIHRQAVREMLDLLSGIDTAWADTFGARAEAYERRVDSAWTQAVGLLASKPKPRVLAAEHQAALLRELGFEVVATYGRPEEFTASRLTELARIGIDSGVGLVVDNLQSGPDAGLELARSLGAGHVNLTNFPQDGDYPATLLANAASLAGRLE